MSFCLKILNADGIVTYINPHGISMLEANGAEDIAGHAYVDFWPPVCRARIAAAIQDAVAGKIALVEAFGPTFKGTPKWWETSFYSIRGPDSTIRIVGISHDISRERRFELDKAIEEDRNTCRAEV